MTQTYSYIFLSMNMYEYLWKRWRTLILGRGDKDQRDGGAAARGAQFNIGAGFRLPTGLMAVSPTVVKGRFNFHEIIMARF